jgi:hypothetical protein
MFTRLFWTNAAERAVKTFAQALAAVLVASGAGLLTADWKSALSTAAMATVVSLLTSLASVRVGPPDSPSLVPTGPPAPSAQAVALPTIPAAVPEQPVAA